MGKKRRTAKRRSLTIITRSRLVVMTAERALCSPSSPHSQDLQPISVPFDMVDAEPRDLNVLDGVDGDDRTLDKLFDGINVTVDDVHMWLVPYTAGGRAGRAQAAAESEGRDASCRTRS